MNKNWLWILALPLCGLVLAGCATYSRISVMNRLGEREEERAQYRARRLETDARLAANFDIVFTDPDFLCTNDTPARASLLGHFENVEGAVPTAAQIDRLIGILESRPELVEPYNMLWRSKQVTMNQRMEFARKIDQGKITCSVTTLQMVLPNALLTDEDLETILNQAQYDGMVEHRALTLMSARTRYRNRIKEKHEGCKRRWWAEDHPQWKQDQEKRDLADRRLGDEQRQRYEQRRAEIQEVKQYLEEGIFGSPDDFRQTLKLISGDGYREMVSKLTSLIWKCGSAIPSTNLVQLIDWVVEEGRCTGTYPWYLCSAISSHGRLSRRELRAQRSKFIEMMTSNPLELKSELYGYRLRDSDFPSVSELFNSSLFEDEEVVLAYDQPWSATMLVEAFNGYSDNGFQQPCSDEELTKGLALKRKLVRFQKQAVTRQLSRKEYQDGVLELVREFGPKNISYYWFKQFGYRYHRAGHDRTGQIADRMDCYRQVPVAEALKMAKSKLKEKEAQWEEEDKRFQAASALASNLRSAPATFSQKVLPRLGDPMLRGQLMESIQWNTNAIPAGNLLAIADWEIKFNPDRCRELYCVMRRPEFSGDMLRQCYPQLVGCCTSSNEYLAVLGLLINPNAPADLLDRAYAEPRLAELRLECYRRNREALGMSTNEMMQLECELAPLGVRTSRNQYYQVPRPIPIFNLEDILSLDAVLKKYLPQSRPRGWSWKTGSPEYGRLYPCEWPDNDDYSTMQKRVVDRAYGLTNNDNELWRREFSRGEAYGREWRLDRRNSKREVEQWQWGAYNPKDREKFYRDLHVEVQLMHQSAESFKREVLPLFADELKRKMFIEVVRRDTNSIPLGNLLSIVDWELKFNPRHGRDLFSVMVRPEFSAEQLRELYGRLYKCEIETWDFRGIHGILCNPNTPKDLLDLAYQDPMLSLLRANYFRSVYFEEDVRKYDEQKIYRDFDTLRKSMVANGWSQERYRREMHEQLKKYLPLSRPEHWTWRYPSCYDGIGYPTDMRRYDPKEFQRARK